MSHVALTRQYRHTLVVTILIALLALLTIVSLLVGSYPLSLEQLSSVVMGTLDPVSEIVLMDYRLPRILTAILVGISFAIAGAIFQTLMRNPLASPDVIGFSAGAGVGALASLFFATGIPLIYAAIAGGLITALFVMLMSWQSGISAYRLILIGIGTNFVLTAVLDLMLSRIDLNQAVEMSKWLAGTLDNGSWSDVVHLLIGLLVLLPVSYWLQFSLDRLSLGQDIATALGIRITAASLALIATGVALTALAVTSAGPLPFIAFVSGPIAKRLVNSSDSVLFTAALVGALVTLTADILARYLGGWISIPTGVFTAFIGAPYLLWLLINQIRRGHL